MRSLLRWIARPARRRVQALIDLRMAEAETLWQAELTALRQDVYQDLRQNLRAEICAELRAELCAALGPKHHAALDEATARLAERIDALALRLEAVGQEVAAVAGVIVRQQALEAGTATDFAAMLEQLERIRRELHHEMHETLCLHE